MLTREDDINARLREHRRRETERVVRHTQGVGGAAGGFPSGLGWEVRLGCLCVEDSWFGRALSCEFVN